MAACGDINNLFLMNDNTCRAAAWEGHVVQGTCLRIKTISSVKFSAAPLASRPGPDHVNISGGLC